jgi:hypothetical protein
MAAFGEKTAKAAGPVSGVCSITANGGNWVDRRMAANDRAKSA